MLLLFGPIGLITYSTLCDLKNKLNYMNLILKKLFFIKKNDNHVTQIIIEYTLN